MFQIKGNDSLYMYKYVFVRKIMLKFMKAIMKVFRVRGIDHV